MRLRSLRYAARGGCARRAEARRAKDALDLLGAKIEAALHVLELQPLALVVNAHDLLLAAASSARCGTKQPQTRKGGPTIPFSSSRKSSSDCTVMATAANQ